MTEETLYDQPALVAEAVAIAEDVRRLSLVSDDDQPVLVAEAVAIADDIRRLSLVSDDDQLGHAVVMQVLPKLDPPIPVVITATTRAVDVKEASLPHENSWGTSWVVLIILLPLIAVMIFAYVGSSRNDEVALAQGHSLRGAPTPSPSSAPVPSLAPTLRG
jgi:hypothetical protein